MASVEQGRLVERAWPPGARRVAPANPENREGRAADQSVRTGRQEGVGEEGRVAFGRGRRVEQGRARAERGERHCQATELRWAVDPLMLADRRLLDPDRQRLTGLEDVDPHDLNLD